MAPRQMRDILIPVLPKLTYCMLPLYKKKAGPKTCLLLTIVLPRDGFGSLPAAAKLAEIFRDGIDEARRYAVARAAAYLPALFFGGLPAQLYFESLELGQNRPVEPLLQLRP